MDVGVKLNSGHNMICGFLISEVSCDGRIEMGNVDGDFHEDIECFD